MEVIIDRSPSSTHHLFYQKLFTSDTSKAKQSICSAFGRCRVIAILVTRINLPSLRRFDEPTSECFSVCVEAAYAARSPDSTEARAVACAGRTSRVWRSGWPCLAARLLSDSDVRGRYCDTARRRRTRRPTRKRVGSIVAQRMVDAKQ